MVRFYKWIEVDWMHKTKIIQYAKNPEIQVCQLLASKKQIINSSATKPTSLNYGLFKYHVYK